MKTNIKDIVFKRDPQYMTRYNMLQKELRGKKSYIHYDIMKDPGKGQVWSSWGVNDLAKWDANHMAKFGLSRAQDQLWWTLHAHGLHRFTNKQTVWVKINNDGEAKYVDATIKDFNVNDGYMVYTYVTNDGQTLDNQSGKGVFGNKDWISADYEVSGRHMQSKDKLVHDYDVTLWVQMLFRGKNVR